MWGFQQEQFGGGEDNAGLLGLREGGDAENRELLLTEMNLSRWKVSESLVFILHVQELCKQIWDKFAV